MANTIRTSLKRFFLLISVLCSPLFLLAQISESFSDGDFRYMPAWFGDTNQFIVDENHQLQLNAIGAGSSLLLTQNNCLNNCEWQFYIRLSFSPSSNNNARVYLSSDMADLRADLKGYFLQFGESGSGDAIELFRQNGQILTSICRGIDSEISKSFMLNVRVVHKSDGTWEIYTDNFDGGGFTLQATGSDTEIMAPKFFGIYCEYTSSNAQNFYFDDIMISNLYADSIPPNLLNIECLSEHEIELSFSESITDTSILNSSNYQVSDGIGNPDTIFLIAANQVKLYFDIPFLNRENHSLSIKNINDLSANIMRDTVVIFSYFEAMPLDLVFNEIMDDPTPSVGLPEFEFLELLNTSSFDINLNGWHLKINEKEYAIGEFTLPANEYLIICDQTDIGHFSNFNSVYALSGFSLLNTGSNLSLKNKNGVIISSFNYQKSQFTDPVKKDGGWSIEQINPMASCLGIDNWAYSTNSKGGSPGFQNSIFSNDFVRPEIILFEVLNEGFLKLQFTNFMDPSSVMNEEFFKIIENNTMPANIVFDEGDKKTITLFFSSSFSKNQTYTLKVFTELKNCLGINLAQEYLFSFSIPDEIKPNDIIINEILFQPLKQGEEYVELYNRSEKILNFSDLEICFIKDDFPNPTDTICAQVSGESKMFFPDTYFILSRSPEKVLTQYFSKNPENFIYLNNLPRLVDDGGIIALKNQMGVFIDLVAYNKKMHYPLLNYTEGVSLEKIHYDLPGYDKSNWMSASFSSGFGTPAFENSQFSRFKNESSSITISPHIFTPNNDGRDDFLKIEYHLEKAGFTANVIIFNSEGIKINQIVSNELLGTQGSFNWKGLDENFEKMPRGIYIVFIELFDLNGKVTYFKETAVLAEAF